MTSLPITTSAPQAAAAAKQTSNSADNGDAQNSQPFGEVLARQISDPATKDTKAGDKRAVGATALLGDAGKKDVTDDKKADAAMPDSAATAVSAGTLAALLPQTVSTPNTVSGADLKTTGTAIDATADQGKRSGASPKANTAAILQPGIAAKTATASTVATPIKDMPVAAKPAAPDGKALPTAELNAALHETVSAPVQQTSTAPQPDAAALASLQNTAANIAAPSMQPVQVTVNAPVNQDKWADEFSQKITWLASSRQDQTAELHLNPPQLGPLDVVIKVSGDQATALFTSPHAAVREAVEQAMPRLRDMLADNGIMLGNTTVSDQTPRDQGQSGAQRPAVPVGNNDIRDTSTIGGSVTRVSSISRHNGIVDTFA